MRKISAILFCVLTVYNGYIIELLEFLFGKR